MKGKIFNAQEVQSILNGCKVMFREIAKIKLSIASYNFDTKQFYDDPIFKKCPYHVGKKIFCKEKWGIGSRPDQFGGYKGFEYEADCFNDNENLPCYEIDYDKLPKNIEIDNWIGNWEQARLMPEWASRLTLEITNIKVERLAEISKEDAIKEGATSRPNCHGYANRYEGWCMNWNKVGETSKWASNRKTLSESDICMGSAQYAFINSWIATHEKPEEKFEVNPFVWVVNFKINK